MEDNPCLGQLQPLDRPLTNPALLTTAEACRSTASMESHRNCLGTAETDDILDCAQETQNRAAGLDPQDSPRDHQDEDVRQSAFRHYLGLLVSRTASEDHKKWMESRPVPGSTVIQIEDSAGGGGIGRYRGIGGVPRPNPPEKKQESRVRSCLKHMARRNRKNPNRKGLVAALKRNLRQDYPSGRAGQITRLLDCLFIWSIWLFEKCSPPRRTRTLIWITPFFVTVTMVVFGFMSGAYPLYRFQTGSEMDAGDLQWGPGSLWGYVVRRDNATKFDFTFLLKWGGRYLPAIRDGESTRWFMSLLLHQSFIHLVSNVLIFAMWGAHLERKYGAIRVAFVAFVGGLGGNFLSAAVEDQCSIVVGSSGAVFGLMAFGVVDLVLNREVLVRPIVRILAIVLFVAFFGATVVLEEYSSHVSHVGGLVCGLVPALLFLPSLKYERLEAAMVWVCIGYFLIYFIVLPAVLYGHVLPELKCPTDFG